MRWAFGYHFTSALTIEEMRPRIEAAVSWIWRARDSDKWGDYFYASPVEGMQVKLFYAPDGGFALDVRYDDVAQSMVEGVTETVLLTLLPAIEASEISRTSSYE